MVFGYSRLICARFVVHQDLRTVLRFYSAALEATGGVPRRPAIGWTPSPILGACHTRRVVNEAFAEEKVSFASLAECAL